VHEITLGSSIACGWLSLFTGIILPEPQHDAKRFLLLLDKRIRAEMTQGRNTLCLARTRRCRQNALRTGAGSEAGAVFFSDLTEVMAMKHRYLQMIAFVVVLAAAGGLRAESKDDFGDSRVLGKMPGLE
jgi:hypothetical protein